MGSGGTKGAPETFRPHLTRRKSTAWHRGLQEKAAAEELAVMILENLSNVDGCPSALSYRDRLRSQPMEFDADTWSRCGSRPQ
jgi:hypothetical protein